MNRYRVMVRGEDGTEFCYTDDISWVENADDEAKEAEEDYPCGNVWIEQYDIVTGDRV